LAHRAASIAQTRQEQWLGGAPLDRSDQIEARGRVLELGGLCAMALSDIQRFYGIAADRKDKQNTGKP